MESLKDCLTVKTRYASGTYHAHVPGPGHKATSTSGPDHAVQALAAKHYPEAICAIKRLDPPEPYGPRLEVADLSQADRDRLKAIGVTHLIHLSTPKAAKAKTNDQITN